MNKVAWIIVVVVVVGVVGVGGLVWRKGPEVFKKYRQSASELPMDGYQWQFTDLGMDADAVSHTVVTLRVGEKTYDLGPFEGGCVEVAQGDPGVFGEKAGAGEVARVQCWFAGGGTEIGVFRGWSKVLVKIGELIGGDEETKPFRGNFKTVLEL